MKLAAIALCLLLLNDFTLHAAALFFGREWCESYDPRWWWAKRNYDLYWSIYWGAGLVLAGYIAL
jgi:hypothetical protein